MRNRVTIAVIGALLVATPALGQTTSTTTTGTTTTSTSTSSTSSTTPAPGSFSTLSSGNQKIAQALYDAQTASAPAVSASTTTKTTSTGSTSTGGTSTATTTSAPTRLTLDQIAGMKQGGEGWGQVFKEMKAQGLVSAKNLGQVVSASHRGSTTSGTNLTTTSYRSTGPVVTNAAGSTTVAGSSDHGKSSGQGGDAGGVAKSGQGQGAGSGADSGLASVSNNGNGRGAGAASQGNGKNK